VNRPSKVVFLSYAHADEDAAVTLYQHLRSAGFDPWLDKFSLRPGTEWKNEIDRAVRHCGAFLSLISPASLDRGGVLAGEMKLALDLRAQRLDDGGILIPVRLRYCPLPSELHHLQALDWYEPDGPARLDAALSPLLQRPSMLDRFRAAIGAKWVTAFAVLIVALVAAWLYESGVGGTPAAYRTFIESRVKPAPLTAAPQIGITLWRVTEDNASGTGTCGFLRFERKPIGDRVTTGDRLRLDVQSSQPGYIYVISQEVGASGKEEPPQLLFPVRSVNDGNNAISPATALMIPPAASVCDTLQLTHAGTEERVSVVFSSTPIAKLALRDTPYPLDPATYADLMSSSAECTEVRSRQRQATRSLELPDVETRNLEYTAAGPDVVFTATQTSKPAIATFSLKTGP